MPYQTIIDTVTVCEDFSLTPPIMKNLEDTKKSNLRFLSRNLSRDTNAFMTLRRCGRRQKTSIKMKTIFLIHLETRSVL